MRSKMKFINDKKLPMLQRLSKRLNKKLTFIDIETNDLVQNDDFAIIQLALIQISEDNIEERVTYVDPGMPIKEFASKLTGITNETVEMAPQFKKFATFISKVAANDILIGFNTKTFVAHGLVKECKKNGVDVIFNHQIDIKPLLLNQINEEKEPKLTTISLEDAKKIYDIKLDDGKAHQADFDLAGTVFLAEEMLMDYGLKYFEKDYLRFLNKDNPEYNNVKKEKKYYNRELPNLNDAKPHMLEFIINSEKRLTDDEVAKQFGFDAYKISFILNDLINSHHEVREKLKNPETVGWLSEVLPQAIKEVWADDVAKGKLKPLYTHLNKIKPRDIDLDYTQLRIAQAELNNTENTKDVTPSKNKEPESVEKQESKPNIDSKVRKNSHEEMNTSSDDIKKESKVEEQSIAFSESDDMPPFDEQDLAQQAMIHQSREEDVNHLFNDDFTSSFENEIANKEPVLEQSKPVSTIDTIEEQSIDKVEQPNQEISSTTTNTNPSAMRTRVSHRVNVDNNEEKSSNNQVEKNDTNNNSNSNASSTSSTNRVSRFSRKTTTPATPEVKTISNESNTPSSKQSKPAEEEKPTKTNNDDFNFTVNENDIEKELTKPKKRFSIRR